MWCLALKSLMSKRGVLWLRSLFISMVGSAGFLGGGVGGSYYEGAQGGLHFDG